MRNQDFDIVILGAGAGKRMLSDKPKVLYTLGGRSMLSHVISLAYEVIQKYKNPTVKIIVVHGHDQYQLFAQDVAAEFLQSKDNRKSIKYQSQEKPLGTADALKSGLLAQEYTKTTLVLYGDQPLIPAQKLHRMLITAFKGKLAIAGFKTKDCYGLGRLIKDQYGNIVDIVEEKDATSNQKEINLCNGGVMAIPSQAIDLLYNIRNNNKTNEYYLTDLVYLAHKNNIPVQCYLFTEDDVCAVNNLTQLACAEQSWQRWKRQQILQTGVQMLAPETVYFSTDTSVAAGSIIEPNVFFGRQVTVIGASRIRAFSYLENTTIGTKCQIGPFCRTRPNSKIGNNVRLGNFVEIKQAQIKDHVRANHLSYLGDCNIEQNVNIGAGVITCNYDGVNKSETIIRKNAFIGSNCSLVAPLAIAENSILGAGSVINEDNNTGDISIARNRQINIRGGAMRYRQRKGNSNK